MLDPCNNLRKLMSKDDLEYFYDAVEKEISVFIKSPPVLGSRAVIEKQSAEAKRDSLWKPREVAPGNPELRKQRRREPGIQGQPGLHKILRRTKIGPVTCFSR